MLFFGAVCVLLGVFANAMLGIKTEIDKVTVERAISEFQQSVVEVKNAWALSRKNPVVLDKVKEVELTSDAKLAVKVNQFGWPVDIVTDSAEETTQSLACLRLWQHLQTHSLVVVAEIKTDSPHGCRFRVTEDVFLFYDQVHGTLARLQ